VDFAHTTAATAAAQEKATALGERFSEWVWEDPARAQRLARTYNDAFNAIVLRDYDTDHMSLPGLGSSWTPRRTSSPPTYLPWWSTTSPAGTYTRRARRVGVSRVHGYDRSHPGRPCPALPCGPPSGRARCPLWPLFRHS